jgi:MFS family permease
MAGVSVPDPPARPLAASVLGVAIIAITGMQLMSTLDGTIVIVALPRMQAELGLSDAGKSWVITAYVLTFGGLLLLGGRVGDAIGHKRAFISGVGVFTIASMACGLATDGPLLIAARAVQGIGAAVAAPTGLALIATTYAAGTARNRAMAMSAAMQGIGSVLGLVLGGALTVISWRLAFLINLPIGVLIVWIGLTRLEETRHERLKLDITGALGDALPTDACLVVSHNPDVAERIRDPRVGLMLSGHTHGGQVCVPGVGALVTNCDIPRKQASGFSTWQAGGHVSLLNVSAGLGTSIYAPIRFACPPEASVIDLVGPDFVVAD